MTFLPAILLAGLFGGIGIGIGAALVCTLVAWVMFFPPYGTFILATPHVITMVIFVVTAALELFVIRTLNVAINDLSEARERSNVLFRELQHRVANNLQFVAAVLMRRRKLLKSDPLCAEALELAQLRLETMSRVHRRLHDPSSLDQPLQAYLEALCADLIKASDTPDIRLEVESPPIVLTLNGLMSMSLIVAELVTNSLSTRSAIAPTVSSPSTSAVAAGCIPCQSRTTDLVSRVTSQRGTAIASGRAFSRALRVSSMASWFSSLGVEQSRSSYFTLERSGVRSSLIKVRAGTYRGYDRPSFLRPVRAAPR